LQTKRLYTEKAEDVVRRLVGPLSSDRVRTHLANNRLRIFFYLAINYRKYTEDDLPLAEKQDNNMTHSIVFLFLLSPF
jgi:hypothetical protein